MEAETKRIERQQADIEKRKASLDELTAERKRVIDAMQKVLDGKALDKEEIDSLKLWAGKHGPIPTSTPRAGKDTEGSKPK